MSAGESDFSEEALKDVLWRLGGGHEMQAVLYHFVSKDGKVLQREQSLDPRDRDMAVYWQVELNSHTKRKEMHLYCKPPSDGEEPLLQVGNRKKQGHSEAWDLIVHPEGDRKMLDHKSVSPTAVTATGHGYWVGARASSLDFSVVRRTLLWLRPEGREVHLCVKALEGGIPLPEGLSLKGNLVLSDGQKLPLEELPLEERGNDGSGLWQWPVPNEVDEALFENARLELRSNLYQAHDDDTPVSGPPVEFKCDVLVASSFEGLRLGAHKRGLTDREALTEIEFGASDGQPFPQRLEGRVTADTASEHAPNWSESIVLKRISEPQSVDDASALHWARYRLEQHVVVPPTVGRPSDLHFELHSQEESPGTLRLLRGPLRGIWTVFETVSGDVEHPKLSEEFLNFPPDQSATTGWEGTELGYVRYPADGEEVVLLDGDFEPFFPPAHDSDLRQFVGGEARLDFKMSVPDDGVLYPTQLRPDATHAFDSQGFIIGEFDSWMMARKVVRLQAAGNRRGVWTQLPRPSGAFGPIDSSWEECSRQGTRILLPSPTTEAGYAARMWFRGMTAQLRVAAVGPEQFTMLLDVPWSIDMATNPDLGPFLPMRAWRAGDKARLQRGTEYLELAERNGLWRAIRPEAQEQLGYEFPGWGFSPNVPQVAKRVAWQGMIFDLSDQPCFCGWYFESNTAVVDGPSFGPFGAYSFAFTLGADSRDVTIERAQMDLLDTTLVQAFPTLMPAARAELADQIHLVFASNTPFHTVTVDSGRVAFELEGRHDDPNPNAPLGSVFVSLVRDESPVSESTAFVRVFVGGVQQ